MAKATNTKQIAVYRNRKSMIEFMDDTRYEPDPMAWPFKRTSRIRVNAKDYSEGTGDKAIDAYYNLSFDEFCCLSNALMSAEEKGNQEYVQCKNCLEQLKQLKESYIEANAPSIGEITSIAEQFSASSNILFSEAGQKITDAIGRLTAPYVNENNILDNKIRDLEEELEKVQSGYVLFNGKKILNYDKYINPENEEERQVTMLKVSYIPKYNFPYLFTVATGWGIPVVTDQNGVMIKEGTTRYESKVNILLDEDNLFPMLQRIKEFLRAMEINGLARYFRFVTNPIFAQQFEDEILN